MKHIGIIAEFNPFHNGHAYLIRSAKKRFPDKQIIIMMSGDYVQRGEPAIFNKYIRTEAALQAGASVVFELPSLFATASAEHFATAAVLALHATSLIDTLCFGTETSDLTPLKEIAAYLSNEPISYQNALREGLASGLSYARARANALCQHFNHPEYSTILKQPNNILAIEYLKAIIKYNLPIDVIAIPRQGSGYHEPDLSDSLCSATALRNAIREQVDIYESLHHFMPESVYEILSGRPDAKPLFWNDFLSFLQYALSYNTRPLQEYCDISNDFSNTLSRLSPIPYDFDTIVDRVSGRHLSQSRIQRSLLNILLSQTACQMNNAKANGYIHYLRLLGLQQNASFLLKECKQSGTVPIINKVTQAKHILPLDAYSAFTQDLQKSHLYNQAFYNRYHVTLPTEYERSVIIC